MYFFYQAQQINGITPLFSSINLQAKTMITVNRGSFRITSTYYIQQSYLWRKNYPAASFPKHYSTNQ